MTSSLDISFLLIYSFICTSETVPDYCMLYLLSGVRLDVKTIEFNQANQIGQMIKTALPLAESLKHNWMLTDSNRRE